MALTYHIHLHPFSPSLRHFSSPSSLNSPPLYNKFQSLKTITLKNRSNRFRKQRLRFNSVSASLPALDLTEENICQVLIDARSELGQIFDTSIGMTGVVELAELDGPYVKLRLTGRFWHTRALVLARVGNYLKNRIPEILEVEIEDEKQLDDSPANF
ncbi:hypothetical protein FCM35_KLT04403 [Carex littledalei]|uniref:Uncharacterized protein n=1 Tax=Carex littledalei TaxID=544730 RepID=A0A833VQE1_9POAL|nr:hypothetical protein FCM35_KLT04403 [Carex littledalei]